MHEFLKTTDTINYYVRISNLWNQFYEYGGNEKSDPPNLITKCNLLKLIPMVSSV